MNGYRGVSFCEEIELNELELNMSSDDEESSKESDNDSNSELMCDGAKAGSPSVSVTQVNDWSTTFAHGSDEEKWLHQLKKLQCIRFVPADGGDSLCHCGQPQSDHPEDGEELDGDFRWTRSSCIVPQKTDAVGKIQFKNDGMQSMFFRLAFGTKRDEMAYLLDKILHLSQYNLYIHFLDFEQEQGEDLDETEEKKLHERLEGGLRSLAQKTKMVISSTGLKTGVSRHLHTVLAKLCEDDVFHTQVFRLACPPWGSLTRDEREKFKSEELMEVIKPGTRHETDEIWKRLSPLCSHYLLFDDGIVYGSPDQADSKSAAVFRKKIEKQLARMNEKAVTVIVLMNGGPKMLDHITKAIERNIPIIIVKKTGGFADKLATNYLRAERVVKKVMDESGKFKVRTVLNLAKELEDVEPKYHEKVWQILKKNHLLTVFDPSFLPQDLDMVICQALLKGQQETKLKELLDSFLTKTEQKNNTVSSSQKDCLLGSENMHMDFLIEAMLNDCSDVVDIILKGTLCLNKHFTMKRFRQLYNREQSLGTCLPLLKAANTKNVKQLNVDSGFGPLDVRRVLQRLLGARFLFTSCQGKHCQCLVRKGNVWEMLNDSHMYRTCLPPVQEMFLWALLTNHQRLAIVFWKYSEDKLASALVAEMILTSLAEREENMDRQFKLQENAKEFADLAVEVLRICYEMDEKLTHDLLMKKSSWWGDESVMELAFSFRSRNFISQAACKSLLDTIWLGHLDPQTSLLTVKIFLGCVPGIFLVPFLSLGSEEPQGFSVQERKAKQCCPTLRNFYKAPIIKYHMNVILFVAFLAVFSYVLLVDLQPKFTIWQGVLCGWVATYLGEEIRQILSVKGRTSVCERFKYYWEEGWNKLDVTVIILFVIGMGLVAVPYEQAYHVRRVFLSIDFVIFSMRLLQAFAVGQEIGPMLTMILKMIRDTVTFVIILFVFILSYAVASESILFPRSRPEGRMLYTVPRKAYWQIYGDFFLDEIESSDTECTYDPVLYGNSTIPRCPSKVGQYVVPVLLAVYCIITHVLLLNLLIAKFNDTYSNVQGEAKIHWAWYRCQIFHEYALRPNLPPPLNAFSCLWWLFKQIFRYFKKAICCRCFPQRCRNRCMVPTTCSTFKSITREKVSTKKIGSTSLQLTWQGPEDEHATRYRIMCYVIKDGARGITDINSPDMVVTLYPMKSYTVRCLTPDTLYRIRMTYEQVDNWQELGETDVKTIPKDSVEMENHEAHCVDLKGNLQTEDPNTQKLDQVLKSLNTNKDEESKSFQQVKGDINQLTQRLEELDKAAANRLNSQISALSEKFLKQQKELLKQTQTSVMKRDTVPSQSIPPDSAILTSLKSLKQDLTQEKESKVAMLKEIHDLKDQLTQMQQKQTAMMEAVMKAINKP